MKEKINISNKNLSNVIILTSDSESLYLDDEDPNLKPNENNFYGKVIGKGTETSSHLGLNKIEKQKFYSEQQKLGIPSFVDVVPRQNENGEEVYDIEVTTFSFKVLWL